MTRVALACDFHVFQPGTAGSRSHDGRSALGNRDVPELVPQPYAARTGFDATAAAYQAGTQAINFYQLVDMGGHVGFLRRRREHSRR